MKSIIQYLLNQYENIFYYYPKANLDIRKIPPKNFVIFLYSTYGDIALLSSFTQFIKNKYKNCHINLITSLKCKYVASLNPNIDKITTLDFPKLWTYKDVEKLKKNLDYDIFLNASFYPNLRYLIPFMPLIEVPYFLFRDKPENLPTPRLKLDFQPTKKDYVVLNLEAGTLGWHKNMPDQKRIKEIENYITSNYPKITFYVNKFYKQKRQSKKKNVIYFHGDLKELIKIMANSSGIISLRNGICDVLAAATTTAQYVIYPEGKFPDEDGIEVLKWGNMSNLGYKAKIHESIINKNRSSSIKTTLDRIDRFIKEII